MEADYSSSDAVFVIVRKQRDNYLSKVTVFLLFQFKMTILLQLLNKFLLKIENTASYKF